MWLRFADDGRLYRYADGKVAPSPIQGTPVLVDLQSRLWALAASRGVLQVEQGGKTLTATIDGLDASSAVVETLDHRFVALHNKGVSELRVDPAGPAPALRELARWPWPLPRNGFNMAFGDRDGFIWFWGGEERMIRFPLPPPAK
jgi:hypothetical protein